MMSVLLLGDENLTFAGCLLQQMRFKGLDPKLTVAVTLSAEHVKDDVVTRAAALGNEGVSVLFGASPLQVKSEGLHAKYQEVVAVLPGLAFQGCPDFIPFSSPLFQLRLHHYLFAAAKAARAVCFQQGRFRVLWSSQTLAEGLGFEPPFPSVDFGALATFCQITRIAQEDTPLDLAQYGNWQPLIHPHEPIDEDKLSLLLQTLQFHTLSMERVQSPQREPVNFLRIPQSLFQYDLRSLAHVNDLFVFDLINKKGEVINCMKLTLKYDPRITGWRGEGAPPPHSKSGKNRGGGDNAPAGPAGFEEGSRKRPFAPFLQADKKHDPSQPPEAKARPTPKLTLRVRRRYCTTSSFAYGDF